MQLILFDDHSWTNLLPLTFTRPAAGLRVGILTIAEKWQRALGTEPSYLTPSYLAARYPCETGPDNLFVNGALLPDAAITAATGALDTGEALYGQTGLLAFRCGEEAARAMKSTLWAREAPEPGHEVSGPAGHGGGTPYAGIARWISTRREYKGTVSLVDYPWKIFVLNGQEIEADFDRLAAGQTGERLSDTVRVTGPGRIFAEAGFRGEHITLNASGGSIYLGRDSEIMEGSCIRGPFALGQGAVVKLGTRIYGPTTVGPYCRVGGEINNSVLQANSNKSHDGYLGNSVLGEWCNLGADTNNSNLKNNYREVKIWNYRERRAIGTGRQFCGMFMGDHSKSGINTMFNTGTVVGVSANIFGPDFPDTFIPSFSWGGASGLTTYRLDKALETAQLVMERCETQLSGVDRGILEYIFRLTAIFRKETK